MPAQHPGERGGGTGAMAGKEATWKVFPFASSVYKWSTVYFTTFTFLISPVSPWQGKAGELAAVPEGAFRCG